MPSIAPLRTLDRSSPTFKADCNAFFGSEMQAFSVQAEAARLEVLGAQAGTEASEAAAALSASLASGSATSASAVALAAANFQGTYSSRTGAANMPYSVSHAGGFWMLLANLTNVTTKVPGVAGSEAYWQRIDRPPPVTVVTEAVQQVVSGGAYAFRNTTAQGAATNLALYSKQFNNGVYIKSECTIAPDATMGPDGNVTADKIVESSINAVHYCLQNLGTAINVQNALAWRFKAAGRSTVVVNLDDGTASGVRATLDLTTGATVASNFGTGSGAVANSYYEGDGWWDLHLTGISSSAGGSTLRALLYLNTAGAYLGNGTSGVYVDDLQVNTGSAVGSRITTTSATVTRAAGLIAPQRAVLPPNPTADQWCRLLFENGSDANVIDPNGQPLRGEVSPMEIDDAYPGWIDLQFVDNAWRM